MHSIYKEGYISFNEYEILSTQVDKRVMRLSNYHPNITFNIDNALFLEFPIFTHLDQKSMSLITQIFKHNVHDYPKNSIILQKGEVVETILFITKGLVCEEINDNYTKNKALGGICNIANLVHPQNINISNVTTIEDCEAVAVPVEELQKLMDANPDFEETVYQASLLYFVRLLDKSEEFNPFIDTDDNRIVLISHHTKLHNLNIDEEIILHNGGFLIQGSLRKQENNEMFTYNQNYMTMMMI